MNISSCLLCSQQAALQLSHVLPAFVFRWKKETSANSHLRTAHEPNRRVQDGYKHYWLCTKCEALFSKPEGLFANRLFRPYLEKNGQVFHYQEWLAHFCASVSWRVLRHYLQENGLTDTNPAFRGMVESAEITWRKFLLGDLPHPGKNQLHILPLDEIDFTSMHLPSNINRYLLRSIHMDICEGNNNLFTYAKLGRFIILGFIHEPKPNQWQGTKVNINHGTIKPRDYVLPRAFGDYLASKASEVQNALNSISEDQQSKIRNSFLQNKDRFIGSDAYQAMNADVQMFGSDAFQMRDQ